MSQHIEFETKQLLLVQRELPLKHQLTEDRQSASYENDQPRIARLVDDPLSLFRGAMLSLRYVYRNSVSVH